MIEGLVVVLDLFGLVCWFFDYVWVVFSFGYVFGIGGVGYVCINFVIF